MKNNLVYKIITVVVVSILVFSLACINVSAFEREDSYIGITGDYDDTGLTSAPGSIYGPGYALINCDDICGIYGWGGEPSAFFKDLDPLNRFLGDVARGNFVSPSGEYTSSDYGTLKYLEFFVWDRWNDRLYAKGIYPVGIESDLILSGEIYVREVIPGSQYSWLFNTFVADACYFAVDHHCLIVACYFDNVGPYDDITDSPKLIQSHEEMQHRLDSIDNDYNSLALRYGDLRDNYDLLQSNHETLQSNHEALQYSYNKLKFEYESADAIDEVFSGTANGFITIIQGISGLGYSNGNVNVTIGGLITICVLAAVFVFVIRLIFGKLGGGE